MKQHTQTWIEQHNGPFSLAQLDELSACIAKDVDLFEQSIREAEEAEFIHRIQSFNLANEVGC